MPKIVVSISLNDLVDAYDMSPSGAYYDDVEQALNIKTGKLVFVSNSDYTGYEIPPDEIEHNPDYIIIPAPSSRGGYQQMEAYVETVEDDTLRQLLEVAIDGKGAFRRFKNVLLDYPEAREAWFTFKRAQQTKIIQEWLDENNLTTTS